MENLEKCVQLLKEEKKKLEEKEELSPLEAMTLICISNAIGEIIHFT